MGEKKYCARCCFSKYVTTEGEKEIRKKPWEVCEGQYCNTKTVKSYNTEHLCNNPECPPNIYKQKIEYMNPCELYIEKINIEGDK